MDYYPSPKGHSQSNAIIERSHRTMEGPATAARLDAGLPAQFWTDMEKTSTYIDNRIPLGHGKFMGVSPHEAIFKKKPPMSHLKPVGCAAVMKVESKKGESQRSTSHFPWVRARDRILPGL